jgi:hypothetical protein
VNNNLCMLCCVVLWLGGSISLFNRVSVLSIFRWSERLQSIFACITISQLNSNSMVLRSHIQLIILTNTFIDPSHIYIDGEQGIERLQHCLRSCRSHHCY